METPSSARRVTRSQTKAAASATKSTLPCSSSRKIDEPETKSRQMSAKNDRSALIDITNDSPIVGLAMGSLETPSSAMSKKRIIISQIQQCSRTPGSGEALLRGQVKTLLQKVEEEAEISKIIIDKRPFFSSLQGLVNSPITLVAPTPANTPQVFNNDGLPSDVTGMSLIHENVSEEKKVEGIIANDDIITRSLFSDFSEKSDSSDCSSVVTYQGGALYGDTESSKADDDDSSIWSIQVNASSTRDDDYEDEDEDDEVEGCEEEYDDNYEEDDDGYGDDGLLLDELCEGISNISVNEFKGKHIRFVYNSDDEIEGEAQVLHLKGLPTPQGKHLRFPDN